MSAQGNILVRMQGVKFQFDDKVVLKGVDFSVSAGEVLVIMGLSGCGKSTLLGILLGLLKADGGSVCFGDKEVTQLTRRELNEVRTHIGMVYQDAALVSSMSVKENIALPLSELSHKTAEEIDDIVNRKLELVGLKDVIDKLPSELSGGMQKRVGLARALALEPKLVLFDEPTAGLDPINSRLIDDLIIGLRDRQKITSVVVTHEMGSAFAVATRMAFLHEGKIILEGSPDDFRSSENPIVRDFLSDYSKKRENGLT